MNLLFDYHWTDVPKILGVALLYALLINLVFGGQAYPDIVAMAWLPSGLGLAALLLGGRKYWIAVLIGAMAAYSLWHGRPWALSFSVALFSNALEPLVALALLSRVRWQGVRFNSSLDHARDYLWLGCAAGISAGVAAATGVAILSMNDALQWQSIPSAWLHWWMGNFLGCVLVAPLILIWRHFPALVQYRERAVEAAACFGLALLCGQVVFLGWFADVLGQIARDYWMFLFVTWAAVRFGRHGVTLIISMTALQGLLGSLGGIGVFGADAAQTSLSNFWFFNVIYSVVGTVLALVISELRQTEALRKSEERWKFALEGSGDGVWDWDIQTNIIAFSARYKEMFGFTDDDNVIENGSWHQRIHPDDRARVVVDLQAYLDGRKSSFVNEHREFCRDGTLKWMLSRGMVVSRDDEGKPLRMIGTNSDITERKRAEQALRRNEERFRRMLETSPIAVCIYRLSDNAVLFANHGYVSMFHTLLSQVLGASAEHTYEHPKDLTEINQALDQGESINNQQLAMCTADGQGLWVMASFTHIEYEGESAVLGWLYDVTNLRKAKELAEETASVKANFLASMSHEIRTPMNAIVGLSQLALNKEVTSDVRDYLEKINFSSQSLLGILNDILDFSKLDAGRVKIENSNFNLSTVLRNLHRLFSLNAEEKFLEFEVQAAENVPTDLVGDALRLQQILSNLLGNAIKFTEHGKISLNVSLIGEVDTQATLLFQVQDTGIGMSEKERAALFVPFSQADSSITRRFGGTGLGLAISNNLLQLMGSKFSVDSAPGRGTVFSFELTLGTMAFNVTHVMSQQGDRRKARRGAGVLAADLSSRAESLVGAHILLAEDNLINQQVATDFLALSGMKVSVANNGREALELLEQHTFDAVLMDVNMPVMGGVEASKHIREQERLVDLPVIALTAGVTQEEREHCLANGMNDFVAKPIDPEKLLAALAQWIKPKGAQQAADEPVVTTEIVQAAPMAVDLSSLPGFDLGNLLKMLRGNQPRVTTLLCNFHDEFCGFMAKVEPMLLASDMDAAQKLIHAIKGAAGSMGAKDLHLAAVTLEDELKAGGFSPATLEVFRNTFAVTMSTLSTLQRP